jgi:hypothetical protein
MENPSWGCLCRPYRETGMPAQAGTRGGLCVGTKYCCWQLLASEVTMVNTLLILINAVAGTAILQNFIFDSYSRQYEQDLALLGVLFLLNAGMWFWRTDMKDILTLYFRRKKIAQERRVLEEEKKLDAVKTRADL